MLKKREKNRFLTPQGCLLHELFEIQGNKENVWYAVDAQLKSWNLDVQHGSTHGSMANTPPFCADCVEMLISDGVLLILHKAVCCIIIGRQGIRQIVQFRCLLKLFRPTPKRRGAK